MLLAALRRLATIVALAVGAGCLLGLAIAGVSHDPLRRGLALGLYVSGAGLAAFGVLLGSRPPVRGKGDGGFIGLGRWMGGGVRFATREEHDQAINLPALFVTVGVLLILIGFGVDTRH